ncbi:MAG TPA: hypothetical protein EYQ50_14280 [Verrucomicrobiales bacterium]|nr:hypothetical protein [Verrucomicrobiales bacterium]
MNNKQLSIVLVGIIGSIAVGFLTLLFQIPLKVTIKKRITDYEAEIEAGNIVIDDGSKKKTSVESVTIEGNFEKFDGQPGETTSEWPRFRGADFSNIAKEDVALAESWQSGGPPVLWGPVKLGEGHSGPAIWKGRVFIMDYDEEKQGDALRCFSMSDGKEIWRRWYKNPIKRNHGVSRTIPAITEKYTVSMGPQCHVMCVDTETGEFLWGIDSIEEYGSVTPLWYTGQCPLIEDNIAVLAPCGSSLMIGVDCATGDVMWQTPNVDKWKMSHSSIIPMTLQGKKMYVYCSMNGVFAVSAELEDRGKLLWKSHLWAHSVTSPSPIQIDEERLFLTVGYGGGSMMMKVTRQGEEFVPEVLFELTKKVFSCEQQTPLFYQDHLFAVLPKDAAALRGQFACMDTDGELVWTSGKTERFGLGPFLMADDKIFILNDNGELTLIKASLDGYQRLAQAQVLEGHDAWAPMALVDGKLLLRDSKQLICLDVSRL